MYKTHEKKKKNTSLKHLDRYGKDRNKWLRVERELHIVAPCVGRFRTRKSIHQNLFDSFHFNSSKWFFSYVPSIQLPAIVCLFCMFIRRIISSLTLFFVYNFGNFVCGFWLLVINYWFFVLFSKCMIFYIWCLISKLHRQLLFFRFIKFSNLLQSWYFYSRLMNFSS